MRFLTTSGVAADLEHLTRDAQTSLVLVTPYLKLSPNFADRLADADARGVAITLLYGKDELTRTQKATLGSLDHLTLYYYQHLHAKCYYNEHRLILSSMNLYEYSEKTNREMGVLVEAGTDVYRDAVAETESIIRAATEKPLASNVNTASRRHSKPERETGKIERHYAKRRPPKGWPRPTKNESPFGHAFDSPSMAHTHIGHCIRCSSAIRPDPNSPYCKSCYDGVTSSGESFVEENYCNGCGEEHQATFYKPLCMSCFRGYVGLPPETD